MKILYVLAAVAAVLAVIAVVAPISELASRVTEDIDHYGGVEYLTQESIGALAEQFADRFNESGYDRLPIDPDEPLLKQRILLITEGMSERSARDVVERLIYLDELDPTTPIDLRIATGGGWTDSAFAIVDTMRAIRAPVDVTAFGGCYSAGTLILAAGTGTRSATPNAILSVHVNDVVREDPAEYSYSRYELARFRAVYERYTQAPREWFEEPGDNQYYFDADEALRMELIDEIAQPQWRRPEVESEARPAA